MVVRMHRRAIVRIGLRMVMVGCWLVVSKVLKMSLRLCHPLVKHILLITNFKLALLIPFNITSAYRHEISISS